MANIQTAVGKPRTREMIEQDVRNLIIPAILRRAVWKNLWWTECGSFSSAGQGEDQGNHHGGNKRFKEDA